MEIVYCGGCGKALRGDDFTRGQAVMLDHRPWCFECKPPDKTPILPASAAAEARKAGSTAKIPRVVVGTGRHEAVRPTTSTKTLYLGIGGIAVALVFAGLVLGRSSPPPPVERLVKPPVDPPRRGTESADAERILRDLEQFASLAPPEKILARCEEQAAKVRGTPQEKRFREIETAAKDQQRRRDQETQLTKDLDALRKTIDDDPRYVRYDEIVKRLKSLRETAGVRAPEIDRRLADYQRARQESPHDKHLGPFEADGEGFVRNWLVLGVFSNDNDKGAETDYLKGEATHEALEGLAVGKPKWRAHASPEGKVDFFRVGSLGIKKPKDWVVVYAACLIQAPEDFAAEIRMGSDDGAALWVDGKLVGKAHKQRALKIDEDRYAVPLSRGLHRVLVKVDNHQGSFEFSLRILSVDGRPIPSLKIWN